MKDGLSKLDDFLLKSKIRNHNGNSKTLRLLRNVTETDPWTIPILRCAVAEISFRSVKLDGDTVFQSHFFLFAVGIL